MGSVPARVTRAAVWTGDGFDIRSVGVPPLGPSDTLVRIRMATVCGSDLHTVAGRRPSPCPSVLGHEAVGEVVAIGSKSIATVGERVIWGVTVACGRCVRCLAGRTAKCCSVRKIGHEPFDGDWPLSGAYAEHIVLPAGATFALVPARMSDAVAAPAACATATVMATLEAAGSVAGRRVLVSGAGMLGVAAVAACVDAGAKVQVVDLDEHRLQLARRFGGCSDTGDAVDVAIDFTGSAQAIAAALARLDIGGTLVLAGSVLPGPAIALDPETVVRQWLTITGVHNYEPRHLIRAVEFLDLTHDTYPWHDVVTDPVDLADIGTAFGPTPAGKLRVSVAM